MRGAFNDLVMTLAPGASQGPDHRRIDRLLAPYGGTGAYARRDLPSHRFLEDELAEQETLSIVMPAVFFGIAAFLLNVVLGRMIDAQREQIASLKALGFPNLPIASSLLQAGYGHHADWRPLRLGGRPHGLLRRHRELPLLLSLSRS